MRRGILGVAFVVMGVIGGCAQEPVAPAPGRMAKTDYVEAFTAGRYTEAYAQATLAAEKNPSGRAHDEAALIAGLSAVRLDNETDAARWLEPLRTSADRDISGRALAGLGLLEQQRGRHSQAVIFLRDAADRLTGDEAARAAYQAGQSYETMGRRDLARPQYAQAAALATDPTLKGQAQARLGEQATAGPAGAGQGGGYTLQLGAFAKLSNAEDCVRKYTPMASRLGHGLPRIEQRADEGRTLYQVRVGRFATRAEAASHKNSFPGSSVAELPKR